ncbi:helix-turn-helix transcriptional regulator [Skermania sp. ID1734]|uniref:helix-turn-helix transcriptional regulator n=1 Tax=Skermania sp. ID1734 TaxID=2597516 RepID=UPI00117DB61E|nr:helix-turn-helix transcriptional regulator [Skermania sp. ID1734]TSE00153.1 helix-turn-helix transcriptional regulator [Skermania sp. ID1734]
MAREEGDELEWRTYGLSLAHRLKLLRGLRGMSQEKLSEVSGIHRNQVSNLERNVSRDEGSADPRLSTIFKLARALDVPPEVLIPNVHERVTGKSSESASDTAFSAIEVDLTKRLGVGNSHQVREAVETLPSIE